MSITEDHEAPDEIIEWRPWPRDPRYIVGADSTIIGPSGRPLKPGSNKGRKFIGKREGGKRTSPAVSVIVCETFHGLRPTGMEAAHEDGDCTNDRAENLSWKTHKENEADKLRHGTHQFGEQNHAAKLTAAQVREFRSRHASGETVSSIALDFGVSRTTLSLIKHGQTWSAVQ